MILLQLPVNVGVPKDLPARYAVRGPAVAVGVAIGIRVPVTKSTTVVFGQKVDFILPLKRSRIVVSVIKVIRADAAAVQIWLNPAAQNLSVDEDVCLRSALN